MLEFGTGWLRPGPAGPIPYLYNISCLSHLGWKLVEDICWSDATLSVRLYIPAAAINDSYFTCPFLVVFAT